MAFSLVTMPDSTADAASAKNETSPPMQFFRAGGFDQLILENASHLRQLRELDPTLWVASSCPTRGLDLESDTLDFVDSDSDGRIRPPEILETVDWVLDVLRDSSTLPEGKDSLRIEQINPDSAEGAVILQTITRIHHNLGLDGEEEVTLQQALDRSGIFAAVKSNGDGVIPASAAESDEIAQLIQDILATVGGETDVGGETGVTASGVEAFFTAISDYLQWWITGHPADADLIPPVEVESLPAESLEVEPGQLAEAMAKEAEVRESAEQEQPAEIKAPAAVLSPEIFPLGEGTSAALAAVNAVRDKVQDFFEQVELAAFDAKAIGFLNFNDSDLASMPGRSKQEVEAMLEKVPLARIAPGIDLPLQEGVNPHFASRLAALNTDAVKGVFGKEKATLSLQDWEKMLQVLAPYESWLSSKAGAVVEPLGTTRLAEILAQVKNRKALEALIEVDAALAAEIGAVNKVEKLLRMHRDFFRLLRNYVSLPQFYDRTSHAIFQMGSLLIDGCMLRLCVEVEDIKQHSTIAANSGIYLVYCTAKRAGESKSLTICAAVTNRDAGRITVGKNAVYYDRDGNDWDARVTQVIINPISLREAAWAPFRKVSDIISSQLEKLSSARQQAMEKEITSTVTNLDKQASGDAKASSGMPMNIGAIIAGGGVALAAVSSSIAYLANTISKINDIYILYTLGVILLIFLAPSLLLGVLRLRRRDIGMILEACGWAINGRMRISLKLARELTHIGKIPAGSRVLDHAYVDADARRLRRIIWSVFLGATVVIGGVSWWLLERT